MNETLASLFRNKLLYEEVFSKTVLVKEEVIEPNTKLIRQGKKHNHFYYVISGQLRVVITEMHQKKSMHTIVSKLHAGDVFGEFVIFNDMVAGADVITDTDCEILKIDVESFKAFLESDPELGYKVLFDFLQVIVTRLQKTNGTLLRIMEYAVDYQKLLSK